MNNHRHTQELRFYRAVIIGAMLMETASAADAGTSPAQIRHQVTLCMKKRMSADRAVSYNEAARSCNAQIRIQSRQVAARVLEEAVKGPHE
jgi:hypothetical protein